ncbi:hypothetical protein DVH24_014799 [Malus domestica]|uniref:Leucine-rich repeat-containing N-terminal plant-type domain-containing protein n=1 Tax=Malus domestica TaxID=3750 RepID=A0A498JZX2_MALDO|nr:hypothetical protein DVH24_014799 [Malus domestica]
MPIIWITQTIISVLVFQSQYAMQIIDTFPCLLKNISTLSVLVLQSNNFYGGIGCPVVKTNGTWPVLHIRDLAYNNFNGEVPSFSLTSWQAMKTKILVSCRQSVFC